MCAINIIQRQTDFNECLQSGFNTFRHTFYFFFCISQHLAVGMTSYHITFKGCKNASTAFSALKSSVKHFLPLFVLTLHVYLPLRTTIRLPSQQQFETIGSLSAHIVKLCTQYKTYSNQYLYIMIYAYTLFHFQTTSLIIAHLWKIAVQHNTSRGRCISSTRVLLNVILCYEVMSIDTLQTRCLNAVCTGPTIKWSLVFIYRHKSFQRRYDYQICVT